MKHPKNCRKYTIFTLYCFLLLTFNCLGQNLPDSGFLARKTIIATRINAPPIIDGVLDDAIWKGLPPASGFVEYAPRNGKAAPFGSKVCFAYDDVALYVGFMSYDPHPDSIMKEMGLRDELESLTTDLVSVDILPYNDGLNMYEFKVNPAGILNDCKYSALGTDINWDAVWDCRTSINDSGWVAEFVIPYAALRFPKKETQEWGINMWRSIARSHEWSTWSFVDVKSQDIFRYYGTLKGLEKINPPLRLSISPFVSGYINRQPGTTSTSYFLKGGIDLKYGINESYTLDMVMIPDFGQVQSDDNVLNLSPFEVQYDEKRQFFTEATEMFNKCQIFYTRRVGGEPRDFRTEALHQNEYITAYPDELKLINATKISGRSADGLGLGFFNALTANSRVSVTDSLTHQSREILYHPLTNFNVIVVDQNLKNNSYLSLINTHYRVDKTGYSANVTGGVLSINNRKNTLNISGQLIGSQQYNDQQDAVFGYRYLLSAGRPSGKIQWGLSRDEISNTYDPNDMGYLSHNNEITNQGYIRLIDHEPNHFRLSTSTLLSVNHITHYSPASFVELLFDLSKQLQFLNYWGLLVKARLSPFGYHDFYESRSPGREYKTPAFYDFAVTLSGDPRKKLQGGISAKAQNFTLNNTFSYFFEPYLRFRANDRLSFSFSFGRDKSLNDYGWVKTEMNQPQTSIIYFGRRDLTTIQQIFGTRYIFTNKAALTLRIRHYWSKAVYLGFYTLREDGRLDPSDYWQTHDINYNAFNSDLQYTWNFAPGSELSLVWKNSINTLDNDPAPTLMDDLDRTFSAGQANSFSLRVLYYFDVVKLKKKNKNET